MNTNTLTVSDTSSLSLAQTAKAFNAGFSGYFMPVDFTAERMGAFCRQFSVDLGRSLIVVPQGSAEREPAGITLLGLREDRGWCGGFGIVPEQRGTGAARLLLDSLVDKCRQLELASLQLEVLTQNERAIKLYERGGFIRTRELVVLRGDTEGVMGHITQAGREGMELNIHLLPVQEAVALVAGGNLGSVPVPSWQRELATLLNTTGIRALVCESEGRAQGALLYQANKSTGQINIGALAFSDPAAGRALLAHAYQAYRASLPADEGIDSAGGTPPARKDHFFILNEPDGSPLLEMLGRLGMSEVARQYEMVLQLR